MRNQGQASPCPIGPHATLRSWLPPVRFRALPSRRSGPLKFGLSSWRRSIGPLRRVMKNCLTCSVSVVAAVDTLPDASSNY
jgi:hypothetical protein